MNQSQLNRCVARATSETVDVVRQIGFTVLTPLAQDNDEAARWLQSVERRNSVSGRRRQQHGTRIAV